MPAYQKWLIDKHSKIFGPTRHQEGHSTALALITLLHPEQKIKLYKKYRFSSKKTIQQTVTVEEEALDLVIPTVNIDFSLLSPILN